MFKSKKLLSLALAMGIMTTMGITALAASESLNAGGATWKGGIDDGTIYSTLQDNVQDGLRYKATVWVIDDKGQRSEKTGTTNGVGSSGQVSITRSATYSNPFVVNRSGYKNYSVVN